MKLPRLPRRLQIVALAGIIGLGAIVLYFTYTAYTTMSAISVENAESQPSAAPRSDAHKLVVINNGNRMIGRIALAFPDTEVIIRDLAGDGAECVQQVNADLKESFTVAATIRFIDGQTVRQSISFSGGAGRRQMKMAVDDKGRIFSY